MANEVKSYSQEMYEGYVEWMADEYPDLLPSPYDHWVKFNVAMDACGENAISDASWWMLRDKYDRETRAPLWHKGPHR